MLYTQCRVGAQNKSSESFVWKVWMYGLYQRLIFHLASEGFKLKTANEKCSACADNPIPIAIGTEQLVVKPGFFFIKDIYLSTNGVNCIFLK